MGIFDGFRRRRRALVCRDTVALVTDYLDGALSASDTERLELHLSACPHCGEYVRQLRDSIDAMGRLQPAVLDEHEVDELIDLYRRWRAG